MEDSLSRTLQLLEEQRKQLISLLLKGCFSLLLTLCIGVGTLLLHLSWLCLLPAGVALFYGLRNLSLLSSSQRAYRLRYKLEVIGNALHQVDQSLQISPDRGISLEEFNSSELFNNSPDRYHCEDLISGKADKTNFYFSEVHAEYKTETRTKNGRQVHWHTIHKGFIFVADFNKNFYGKTLIRPRCWGNTVSSWLSKIFLTPDQHQLVELENAVFTKTFLTYSENQIEARYLLTPVLMEKIVALNERSEQPIVVSFIHSSMYIAFPTQTNYFEPSLLRSLQKTGLPERDVSLFTFMYDIVHDLDLNTRIWTKT